MAPRARADSIFLIELGVVLGDPHLGGRDRNDRRLCHRTDASTLGHSDKTASIDAETRRRPTSSCPVTVCAGATDVKARDPDGLAAPRSWVRSLRTECLDHWFVFNEPHLRSIVAQFVAYFNQWRHTDLSDSALHVH